MYGIRIRSKFHFLHPIRIFQPFSLADCSPPPKTSALGQNTLFHKLQQGFTLCVFFWFFVYTFSIDKEYFFLYIKDPNPYFEDSDPQQG